MSETPANDAVPTSVRGRRLVSDAVLQWATGEPVQRPGLADTTRIVARIVDPRHEEGIAALLDARDVLLHPSNSDTRARPDGGPLRIDYDGRLEEPGDVAWISGMKVQLQDYASIPFLPLSGATIARIRDATGWSAFLEDADAARASGVLVPQLLGSAVAIGGLPARPSGDGRVAAVEIDGDGVARLGVDGAILGGLADPAELGSALDRSRPALDRLAAIGGDLVGDVGRRPWLGLYRAALAFAGPDASGRSWSVSGLGGSLHPDGDATEVTRDDLLLLHRDSERVLVEPRTLRRFSLSPATALVVECVLATANDEAAVERLASSGTAADATVIARLVDRLRLDGITLRSAA
ncbi:hypothetical protein HQQ81_07085 [Microbacteriaceae bacterium VKM Ac-2854]|nr:hypothetical protein [Microbacteriaceae bacterium VKM Ac-2854]